LADASRLAFKAKEIEERVAVYFHRPVGMILARGALAFGLSPTAVTIAAAIAGVAGGVALAVPRLALLGFGLIVLHGILDSSDGQLARMTGRTSELGRVLDGAAGYATHVAIYVGVILGWMSRGGSGKFVFWVLAAGACNIIHAQMYDYYRGSYSRVAVDGVVASPRRTVGILGVYEAFQRRLAGAHHDVERAIARRARGGPVRDDDRANYRRAFYPLVRGWNLLGDNTRFYAIGVLVLAQRLEWFPALVLLPMNVVFVVMWFRQARADRRFLAQCAK
jgi:phosphatidylglycerophosphate synthase